MAERTRKGILITLGVWTVGLVGIVCVYQFLIKPMRSNQLVDSTSAKSLYHTELVWPGDSFSGYAILRSQSFINALAKQGIRWTYKPVPKYLERVKLLAEGEAQFAVFPIGTYITAGARSGNKFPVSQILNLDESIGADAIVAFKGAVPNINALNNAQTQICLTPDSPSETLAQVAVANFALDMLPANWACERNGADAVYREMMSGDRSRPMAYVLWEPYVTMALADPEVIVLFHSGRCKGCILDGLYGEREYLKDHADVSRKVVEAYLRAQYHYSQGDRMVELVQSDAAEQGETLTREQAEKIVAGIRWTNTLENYAYFAIVPHESIRPLEDVIHFLIEQVLLPINALTTHPLAGKESSLYYDGILRSLHTENFHPAKTISIVPDAGPSTADLAAVRGTAVLPSLTDQQWTELVPVGNKRIAPIDFRRGSAQISDFSQTDIDTAASELKVLAEFYIIVRGHAIGEDSEINRTLARSRADAVFAALKAAGIPEHRLHTAMETNQKGEERQACVTLELAQAAY